MSKSTSFFWKYPISYKLFCNFVPKYTKLKHSPYYGNGIPLNVER